MARFCSLLAAHGAQVEFKGPGDPYDCLGTAAIFPHGEPECVVAAGKRAFKESAFLRFWTLEEAFAKSIGEGLKREARCARPSRSTTLIPA